MDHSPEGTANVTATPRPCHRWQRRSIQWGSAALFMAVVGFLIVVVLPNLSGNRTLVILSGSMEPTIHMGAAAVMKPVPSGDLQVGDVIAYTPNTKGTIPIVHRIVEITDRDGQRYYRTRGDANAGADANAFTLPATAWRLWYNIPVAGYVVAFASSRIGTLALILVPAALLTLLKIGDWRKGRRLAPPPHAP